MSIPGVSIILCTHNGALRLPETLKHLCCQVAIDVIEIVVVDNASTDETKTVAASFLEKHSLFPWKIETEPRPGLMNARLAGLNVASHDIVLYCDDDNYLCEDYVSKGYELMKTHQQIGVLGGYGIPVFEGQKPAWFDTYSHSFAVGEQSEQNGKIEKVRAEIYGAGSFWRKDVLMKAYSLGYRTALTGRSGKKLTSGEDVEWCYLIQLLGYEVWYDRSLVFEHIMPASRMHWSYYLKLKEGISASWSKLFPYAVLMDNDKTSYPSFLFSYIVRSIKLTSYYFLLSSKQILNRKHKSELQDLKFVQARSRFYASIKDCRTSMQQFNRLKTVLHQQL